MPDETEATQSESPATISKHHDHDWLPLLALASHAAGDFPLQTNDMAARKFDSRSVRAAHVAVYIAAFVPMVIRAEWGWHRSARFLVALAATHYVIDSRRWAEPAEGFETRPLWFDQTLHIVALAVSVEVAQRA